MDLFNHGYYWEAHEVWEGLWQACGRSGLLADFFKALIHFAAAGVKVREGVPAGVQRHLERTKELLALARQRLATGQERLMGLDVTAVQNLVNALLREPVGPDAGGEEVRPVWVAMLEPG